MYYSPPKIDGWNILCKLLSSHFATQCGDNIKKEAGQGRSQPADVLELYFFNADDVILTDNDLSSLPDCPVEVDF